VLERSVSNPSLKEGGSNHEMIPRATSQQRQNFIKKYAMVEVEFFFKHCGTSANVPPTAKSSSPPQHERNAAGKTFILEQVSHRSNLFLLIPCLY
jgi:hypothetical protein